MHIQNHVSGLQIFSSLFVHQATLSDHAHAEKIPGWVNGVFNWYAQGNISEDKLIQALQFLIDTGVIDIAHGANLIAKPILDELAKPNLLFHTDEILTGDIAFQWIDEHTDYMINGNQDEIINKLKSPNGEYYMVVLPENYGQDYTVIDTAGTEIMFDDLMVIPMICDIEIYAIQGFGISEMYFMYNDVRFDSGTEIMTGFCGP
jgi:hypothetical protein